MPGSIRRWIHTTLKKLSKRSQSQLLSMCQVLPLDSAVKYFVLENLDVDSSRSCTYGSHLPNSAALTLPHIFPHSPFKKLPSVLFCFYVKPSIYCITFHYSEMELVFWYYTKSYIKIILVFISAVVTKLQRFLMISLKPIFLMTSGLFSAWLWRIQGFPGTHTHAKWETRGRQTTGYWKRIRDDLMGTHSNLDTEGSVRLS